MKRRKREQGWNSKTKIEVATLGCLGLIRIRGDGKHQTPRGRTEHSGGNTMDLSPWSNLIGSTPGIDFSISLLDRNAHSYTTGV